MAYLQSEIIEGVSSCHLIKAISEQNEVKCEAYVASLQWIGADSCNKNGEETPSMSERDIMIERDDRHQVVEVF